MACKPPGSQARWGLRPGRSYAELGPPARAVRAMGWGLRPGRPYAEAAYWPSANGARPRLGLRQGGSCYALGPSGRGGPTPRPGPPDRAALRRGRVLRTGRPYAEAGSSGQGGRPRRAQLGLASCRASGGPSAFGLRRFPTTHQLVSVGAFAPQALFGPDGLVRASGGGVLRTPGALRPLRYVRPLRGLGPSAKASGACLTTTPRRGSSLGRLRRRPRGPVGAVRSSGGPLLRRGVYAVGPATNPWRDPLWGSRRRGGPPAGPRLALGV